MLTSRYDTSIYYFTKPKLWIRKGWSVKEPQLVIGYPGIGLVGEIVIKFLVKSMKAVKVGFITSPFFSSQVLVDKNGVAKLIGVNIFIKNRKEGDLILALGQKHQEVMGGELETTEVLLKFFKKLGGKNVYSIGGHLSLDEKNRVWGVASEPSMLNILKEREIAIAPAGTPIVGSAGIAIGLCSLLGLKGIGLLGVTKKEGPDFDAARAIIEKLSLFLNLIPDYSLLHSEEEKWHKVEAMYEERLKKLKSDKTLSLLFKEFKRPEYLG